MFRLLRILPLMLAVLLLAGSGCSNSDGDKPIVDSHSSRRGIQPKTSKKLFPAPKATIR